MYFYKDTVCKEKIDDPKKYPKGWPIDTYILSYTRCMEFNTRYDPSIKEPVWFKCNEFDSKVGITGQAPAVPSPGDPSGANWIAKQLLVLGLASLFAQV